MVGGEEIAFATTATAKLFGRGAGAGDDTTLYATSVSPHVENRESYVPYYYSTDGYAALGVVEDWAVTGPGKTNYLQLAYSSDGSYVRWNPKSGLAFEVYFMPAETLDQATAAYYQLTGLPPMPPMYAFGFLACRWGWENRSYIEETLSTFRSGQYPIDAYINDFGWFTNVSDYPFPPTVTHAIATTFQPWFYAI